MKQSRDGTLEGGIFTTGTGQRIAQVHEASPECWEHGCVIHAPSQHHLRHMPTHWRGDRALMERVCKHGVGHPDPDQIAYWCRTLGEGPAMVQAIHGCDGCCSPEETPKD